MLNSVEHEKSFITSGPDCIVYFVLKVYGYTSIYFAMFSKGDNFCDFLFAYLDDRVFPKRGLLLKERIWCDGSKFFPL